MAKNQIITVQNTDVTVIKVGGIDYISITDIAKFKSDDPTDVIRNWLRNRNTIEYLGIWESLYNPGFKHVEFEGFRKVVEKFGNVRQIAYLCPNKIKTRESGF